MKVQLISPHLSYENSYRQYIEELGDEERYPFPMNFDYSDFQGLLRKLADYKNGVALPDGFVPSSTFWLIYNGELVGVSNLRHYLNDRIREHGGHIGLGVRPKYRGKGFGSELLRLSIEKAKEMGVTEVHIHCHKDNEPSANMILSNGAKLDSEVLPNDSKKIVQRYKLAVT